MKSADLKMQPHRCGDCKIKYRAVCSKCDTDELEQLEQIKYYRTFDAGQTIMFEGDEMNFVASVVSGVATLTQTMSDGRIQMVGLLLPSDFIGRPGRDRVSYEVVAINSVTLCCFRRKPFEELLAKTPSISERLMEIALDELDIAREWMLLLGRKTAREKISSLIALIAKRNASLELRTAVDGVRFDLPISREAMANYLGMTIETVSRQMSALKRDEVIVLDGNRDLMVPDLERLLAETGDDADGVSLI